MSEWKEYKLGDVAEIKGGKRLPKGSLLVDYETLHPYIRVTDLGSKWIKKTGLQFVTADIQKSISRYVVKSGDVILSIVGSIGLVGRISKELNGANLTENCVKLITNKQIINDDFLFYNLISNSGQEEIKKRNVGSTQPKLPLYNIKDIDILLPSLPEQIAIASVLSSLDDKIDLLQRQNETLEKMAESLFRQWFVEGAKEKWELGKLSDLVVVKYGKDHKKLLDGPIPMYGSGGLMRYVEKPLYSKESVLIPRKGTLGNVMYQNEPFWTVDTMFYTEMKVPNIAKFIYHFLCDIDLASMNVGSAVPSMTTEVLNNLHLEIPPKNILEKFEEAVSPFYKKTKSNQIQICTLIALRDTLLPKLMGGEVRVKN